MVYLLKLVRSSLDHCAAAARAASCGAAQAMRAGLDSTLSKCTRIEFGYRLREAAIDAQVQHLIEVAIIKPACPVDTDEISAHQSIYCGRIESIGELAHVPVLIP